MARDRGMPPQLLEIAIALLRGLTPELKRAEVRVGPIGALRNGDSLDSTAAGRAQAGVSRTRLPAPRYPSARASPTSLTFGTSSDFRRRPPLALVNSRSTPRGDSPHRHENALVADPLPTEEGLEGAWRLRCSSPTPRLPCRWTIGGSAELDADRAPDRDHRNVAKGMARTPKALAAKAMVRERLRVIAVPAAPRRVSSHQAGLAEKTVMGPGSIALMTRLPRCRNRRCVAWTDRKPVARRASGAEPGSL
jgi:hypothetical protein